MFKQCVVASVLAVSALSVQAAAVQNDLGVLGASADLSFAETGDASSFVHLYHFELDAPGTIAGSFENLVGLTLDRVKLVSDGAYEWLTLGADHSFSYEDQSKGYYALYVFGNAADGVNSYSGSLMAQPVPEPESFAMLLAGLGVMGAIAARRRKPL